MEKLPEQDKICFRIPGDARFLFLVRTVVTALARAAKFPSDEIDKIEVAVDEACTNVIDHAYRDMSPKPPIDLEIQTRKDAFIVDVMDCGQSFNFSAYEPPVFPDHWMEGQTRGVGLYLIQQCMDNIQYEQLPENINRLRLTKRVGSEAASAAS